MTNLRKSTIRLAASYPVGSPGREKLLEALKTASSTFLGSGESGALQRALKVSDWDDLDSWGILEEFESRVLGKDTILGDVIATAYKPLVHKCGFYQEGAETLYYLHGTLTFKFKAKHRWGTEIVGTAEMEQSYPLGLDTYPAMADYT